MTTKATTLLLLLAAAAAALLCHIHVAVAAGEDPEPCESWRDAGGVLEFVTSGIRAVIPLARKKGPNLTERMVAAEAELVDLNQRVGELTSNLNELLGSLTKLETWIPSVDTGIQALNKAVEGIAARVTVLENLPAAASGMTTPTPIEHGEIENHQGDESKALAAQDRSLVKVHSKFGKDKYQEHLEELEGLRQIASVEEYYTKFEELMHRVLVYNQAYDETYFVTKFVGGLKTEIKAAIYQAA
ncbi:hypothetical protein OsJ_33416 [Oryza sativa Japonica Group]|uniref:Retrotransposon gag domain-containing protein n=1 Tax=Oryza sativa subsp. japonica TaxID=39947 RepID=A3C9V2_ORYSJ|nr:hypothetical protein OsJ_33416 [Oryza sativa Japonica Group]